MTTRALHRYIRIMRKYAQRGFCDGTCADDVPYEKCIECSAKIQLGTLEHIAKGDVKKLRKREREFDATEDR